MSSEGWFWLPFIVTIAAILLSLLVFTKLLKEKKIPTATAGNNTSSAPVPASTAAAAAAAGGEYEVFLSFRGGDTRYGFTDYLYTDLVGAGIRTFRDDNELRVGEVIGPELLKAIKDSKISIPIFSKNYASSKWCLLELAQMVECRTTLGQKILPLFYDVEPSDVRNQTGSYEQAFRNHKNRFGEKIVQGWKDALREVGELKGWELKKETTGHEGKLVEMVTSKVLLELKKNYMDVTENLVGIDHHKEEMMTLIDVDSDDVRIVGIHGMGGIGKTTIAKFIYNQLSEHFEGCSFLADVRERSQQHKGFVDLQNELCAKILKRENLNNISSVDEGLNMIKNTVCRKKVLIVLDDVDEKSQFDKLAGKRDWFASGSRIIVTTRNKQILNLLDADRTYEPPPMESNHSLQLFSKHSFRSDFPPDDYDILSRQVVDIAAGLPLALENIGSFLYGKGKGVWEDTLKKLKKIPEEDVQKKLGVSYEALNYKQQQIFLDIACLFIGEDKILPFYMWDDCEFYPTYGIDVLVLRSLVKIGDDNILRMHDQLRDLGRQIVRQENFKEPGRRSRLWSQEDALKTLEECMGTRKVEALRVESYSLFTNKEFEQLKNLRFLYINGGGIVGDFKNLLSNLRWLKWPSCSGSLTLTNFRLRNLVILDLSYSYITQDWEAWSQIKMAQKLKVLDLTNCYNLIRTPDFATFVALERLILKGCSKLVQIDPSIGTLINLKVLDLSKTAITELPDALGNLENLEEINASLNFKLQGEIPDIGRLSSLRILKFNFTKIRSLPTSIRGLSHLQTLGLYYCRDLQSLPELPPSLTSLGVTCKSMEFPSLSSLVNLKEVYFSCCRNLVEIPRDIEKLSKLETLTLYAADSIRTLPVEIGALSRLKILRVQSCTLIQCILGLPSSLLELSLEDCKLMERLPDLSSLEKVSQLKISQCYELMEIQGLGKLESLMDLDVSWCRKLAKFDGLERLKSLRYLDTSGCESLERLPDMSNLGMLKQLKLCKCQKLAEVEGLSHLKSLERLDLSCCTSLKMILDLSNLKKLKELKIRGWENLNAIQGFGELKSLEVLDIGACEIEKSPDLSKLQKLELLDVSQCKKLTKIQGLEELKSLKLLDISGCESIEKLPDLSNTQVLTEPVEAMV